MKSKLVLSSLTILLTSLFVFIKSDTSEEKPEKSADRVLNYVRCTSAKFLLNDVDTTRQIAPLFENLGDLTYIITTKDKKAQTFFNQGLRLTYAFNHAEAHRSFMEASRIDPVAPMPY